MSNENVTLPLLPLKSGVILPGMVFTMALESDEARVAVDAARSAGGRLLLVPHIDGRYANVGVIAEVMEEGTLPGGLEAIAIRGDQRATTEQNVLQYGAILAGELDNLGCRVRVTEGLGFHPKCVAGPGNSSADGGALIATNGDRLEAPGQRTFFHHFSDDPNVRVTTVNVRNQQESPTRGTRRIDRDAGLIGFKGHGEYHARQNDAGLQGEKRQGDILVRHCKILSSN